MLNQGSCHERLAKARHVLEVLAVEPELGGRLGLADLASELARGWALYEEARRVMTLQELARANALGAAEACAGVFAAARAAQGRLTALARVMITDPADRDRLGLRGRRAEALAPWLVNAGVFHANLNAADRRELARVGVEEAALAHAAGLLADLAAAHAACVAAKAASTAAVAIRDRAFAGLAGFMSMVVNVARVVEADTPLVVAKLGMTADGRRRKPVPKGWNEGTKDVEVERIVSSLLMVENQRTELQKRHEHGGSAKRRRQRRQHRLKS